jgi:hypothetical protein
MKTKLFKVFLVCFLENLYQSQTLIKTADFKMEKAAAILRAKEYTIEEQDETYIKIKNKENSVLFIDIDENKKYLYFNTNILMKENVSKEKIEKLLLEINDLNMIKAKYNEKQNSILFQYFYWITDSFTSESFEDAVKEFYLYQGDSYGLDKDKLFSYE